MKDELDFWALEEEGYFEVTGEFKSTWLQEHREDPYWMAHQLMNALGNYSSELFLECWKLAREIHGIEE